MAITFDQFMYGIGYQETRGNKNAYHEVNSYGAVGKYQVLKSNVPTWSRRVLGYSISWQKFRDSPDLQEKIVRGILKGYFDRYGARGAAASWYAGEGSHNLDMSTRPQSGGPSIKSYVDSVLGWAGGSPGDTSSGGTYAVGTVTPKLDKYELAEKYGLTYATIKANKEIYKLFQEAVKGGYDADLFTAKLKNTKWWRTTSDANRKFFMLRTGDPATYKQKWTQNQFAMNKLAVDVGLGNQINSHGQSSATLKKAIYYKMRDGWSDARVKAYLGTLVTIHGSGAGGMYGEAGEAYDQIFALSYADGQHYSRGWYQKNIRDVVAGKTTLEALQAQIRNAAASKYYSFATQIRAGQNVLDLAQPYVSAVAQILELPQTDIDLTNKWVAKAMTSKAAAGQQSGTQYPMWQFENDLRSDPLWKKTNNARESMFSVAHQVAKDFGMAY